MSPADAELLRRFRRETAARVLATLVARKELGSRDQIADLAVEYADALIDALEHSSEAAPAAESNLGSRITAALGRAGKDIRWLSERCRVRWQTAQYWAQGKHHPSGRYIRAIASALDISPEELLGHVEK